MLYTYIPFDLDYIQFMFTYYPGILTVPITAISNQFHYHNEFAHIELHDKCVFRRINIWKCKQVLSASHFSHQTYHLWKITISTMPLTWTLITITVCQESVTTNQRSFVVILWWSHPLPCYVTIKVYVTREVSNGNDQKGGLSNKECYF